MIERICDLWDEAEREQAAIVITTNGSVRTDGCCVMGRGCALEARLRFEGIERVLGQFIQREGNHVAVLRDLLRDGPPMILSFPVKHRWHDMADVRLIEQSARELVNICDSLSIRRVVMPRPGCGNGRLRWENVKPVIEPLLDDRFVVVSKEE